MRIRSGLVVVFGVLLAASACATSGPSASPSSAAPSSAATPSASGSACLRSTASPTTTPARPRPDPPSAGGSELTIVVDDGTGSTPTWQLTCDPTGGDHPDAEAACAAIERTTGPR